jgi:hypothetical protein
MCTIDKTPLVCEIKRIPSVMFVLPVPMAIIEPDAWGMSGNRYAGVLSCAPNTPLAKVGP